jgi:hypothetical protein
MEKKELLEKLIAHYEESIELVKAEKRLNKAKKIISERNVSSGICWCAYKVFDTIVYDKKWVENYKTKFGYWVAEPCCTSSISDAIQLLQVRVDIMRKELENE